MYVLRNLGFPAVHDVRMYVHVHCTHVRTCTLLLTIANGPTCIQENKTVLYVHVHPSWKHSYTKQKQTTTKNKLTVLCSFFIRSLSWVWKYVASGPYKLWIHVRTYMYIHVCTYVHTCTRMYLWRETCVRACKYTLYNKLAPESTSPMYNLYVPYTAH